MSFEEFSCHSITLSPCTDNIQPSQPHERLGQELCTFNESAPEKFNSGLLCPIESSDDIRLLRYLIAISTSTHCLFSCCAHLPLMLILQIHLFWFFRCWRLQILHFLLDLSALSRSPLASCCFLPFPTYLLFQRRLHEQTSGVVYGVYFFPARSRLSSSIIKKTYCRLAISSLCCSSVERRQSSVVFLTFTLTTVLFNVGLNNLMNLMIGI